MIIQFLVFIYGNKVILLILVFNCSVLIKNYINDNKFIYNSFLDCFNVINVKFNSEIDQKKMRNQKQLIKLVLLCNMKLILKDLKFLWKYFKKYGRIFLY